MEAEDIRKVKGLARKADQAILDLTEEMRGAVHYGSVGSQIDFLEHLNVIEPKKAYEEFKDRLLNDERFKDSYIVKKGANADAAIQARFLSHWHGIEMDAVAVPDKAYGSRLEIRWKSDGSRKRPDSRFETKIWDWEDENAISRIVVGYAVGACSNRGCFERWQFLPKEKGDSE